ncbi:auxin efflux carrier family protein [Gottschalkia purinilytica]|uniref:Auxin efflux carrier family protein n=1 Tax=Gottschalkia purinilytica TaxID=1503 RepID=A0A0L0WE46_GOTPU|nr:AEC family transporter [Gottschalkia purinilytica]KNF09695.1 auxin efflux carrier family protein [Gottschalkia purinilytica]
MILSNVLNQTIILFILVIVGYIIKKINILTDDLIKGFSEFILKLTLPLLIMVSMDREFSKDRLIFTGLIFGISVVIYFMKTFISTLFVKMFSIKEPQKGVYKMLIIFSNLGFMGIPVINAMYGEEGVFYAAILNIVFNIFLWTMGVEIITSYSNKEKCTENGIKKLLLNPGIGGVMVGLILFLTPLKLPQMLYDPMYMIGNTTTPLAMIVVGGLLGGTKIDSMFKNYKLIIASITRTVIIPLILLGVFMIFKLPKMIAGVIIVSDSMPSAANVAIFARRYESDYDLASQGVFISTLINMATIPLILYLFSKIYGL